MIRRIGEELRGRWASDAPVRRPPSTQLQGWRGRGVGHCVEKTLAEDRLTNEPPVGCLTASQVEGRRPLSRTQTLRKEGGTPSEFTSKCFTEDLQCVLTWDDLCRNQTGIIKSTLLRENVGIRLF